MAKEDNFSYKEYLAIGAAVAASIVVSLRIGLSPKWEHGVVFAALLFGVLITALRPIWRERFFWRWLVGSLLGIRPRDIPRLLRAIQSLAWLAAAGGLMLVGSIGALAYARRQHELMESAALNKSLDQGPDVRRSDLEDVAAALKVSPTDLLAPEPRSVLIRAFNSIFRSRAPHADTVWSCGRVIPSFGYASLKIRMMKAPNRLGKGDWL